MIKYCPRCGERLPYENAEICTKCGFPLGSQPSDRRSWIMPIVVIGFVMVLIAVISNYILAGAGFFQEEEQRTYTTLESPVSEVPMNHTPSEILQGHLDSGETRIITTQLRDPDTTRYTLKLIGPEKADFDLYVKNEDSRNLFDYSSNTTKSTEKIDIWNPRTGNYSVILHSYEGSGDYVLYIDYEYG